MATNQQDTKAKAPAPVSEKDDEALLAPSALESDADGDAGEDDGASSTSADHETGKIRLPPEYMTAFDVCANRLGSRKQKILDLEHQMFVADKSGGFATMMATAGLPGSPVTIEDVKDAAVLYALVLSGKRKLAAARQHSMYPHQPQQMAPNMFPCQPQMLQAMFAPYPPRGGYGGGRGGGGRGRGRGGHDRHVGGV